jgi:hypothetical protein
LHFRAKIIQGLWLDHSSTTESGKIRLLDYFTSCKTELFFFQRELVTNVNESVLPASSGDAGHPQSSRLQR